MNTEGEGGVTIKEICPEETSEKIKEDNVPETHCHICNKEFRRHSALIGHIQTHFDDENEFECDICEKSFKTKFNLQKHRVIHLRSNITYRCEKCNFTTKGKEQMAMHKVICMKPYILHKCRSCNFETSSVKLRDEHLKMHSLQKTQSILYKCRICKYETKDVIAKNDHLKKHTIYKCRKCPFETRNENSKTSHETTVHPPSKCPPLESYKCKICSKKFSGLITLFEHRKLHSGVKCKKCGEIVSDKPDMSFLRFSHDKEPSDVCLACGSSLSVNSLFDTHENIRKEKLSCKCGICGKQFVVPSQLFVHKKERHPRETGGLQAKISTIRNQYAKRNCMCRICGTYFSGIVEYTKHKLCHFKKDENLFSCKVCGSNFKEVFDFVKHRKTHF